MTTLLLASLLFATVSPSIAKEPPSKELIEWGWDEPDTKFIRENIGKMKEIPLDELIFHMGSSKTGGVCQVPQYMLLSDLFERYAKPGEIYYVGFGSHVDDGSKEHHYVDPPEQFLERFRGEPSR